MNHIVRIVIMVLIVVCGSIWISRLFSRKSNNQIELHQESKKLNYLKKLQNIHIGDFRLNKIAYHTKLCELYYAGVPNRYDNDGNSIKGIEPNALKVIHHLKKIIEYSPQSQIDSARLELAKLYHLGMHKFKPQLKVAKKMYTSILWSRGGTKDDVYVQTEALLERINKEIYEVHVHKCLSEDQARTEPHSNHTVNNANNRCDRTTPPPFCKMRRPQPLTIEQRETVLTPPPIPARRNNDPQNTHNSQVISTAINSINNLQKSTVLKKSLPTSLKEIRKFLKNIPKSDKREDALKSLNRIERNTSPFSFSDMKEVDILHLVWNRMYSDVHKDNLDNVKESLYNQLAGMQEHGLTVCATGRFTRIVDTLNVIDEDVSIKPSYIINEEMMNKSSKIRENMLNAYSETERKELEKGTSATQEEYDNKLKSKIVDTLQKDYVETKILSQEKFDHQIKKWINEI